MSLFRRGGPLAAPPSSLEAALGRAMAEVLGLESVGAHDDFFKLGGNSVQAMWLLALVQERFGVDVPIAAVFDVPTVAQLAAVITRMRGDEPPVTARLAVAD